MQAAQHQADEKTTLEIPDPLRLSTASTPLFSSLAVSTTVTPLAANSLHIPNPIPLFAPVTTAYLKQKKYQKASKTGVI